MLSDESIWGLEICCTYRQEEHAVHSKRGVTGVEGQPGGKRR